MSAFMVTPIHINAIVTARYALAARHFRVDLDSALHAEAQMHTRTLAEACYESVTYRYKNYPAVDLEAYQFAPIKCVVGNENKFLARVINACRCYSYQACEAPTWELSKAKQFVDDVLMDAAGRLARKFDNTWGDIGDDYFAVVTTNLQFDLDRKA